MDDGQVPDGTAFDLLHSEGAALYLSNHGHASLKSAPEELNDSLDGDSNSGLGDDSLDLANEKAFEFVGPVTHTEDGQIAQQDSQPPVTAIQPSILTAQSSTVQPTPLPDTEESISINHTQESKAKEPKVAPSFGKRKPAFKPPTMHGSTTATTPSKVKLGKLNQMDTSPDNEAKLATNEHTSLKTQSLDKVEEGKRKKGNVDNKTNSDVQKVIKQTTTKLEKKATEQVVDEAKRTERERKKEEAAKKKLLSQQRKLEKQQKLQEKEAEREQKKQEQERKEREREEKKQERERKEQEKAQKKCERELKKQEKELKKQELEKKRLEKEQQKQTKKKPMDKGPLPAALLSSVSMGSSSSQPEVEFAATKGSSTGNGDTKEINGRAKLEEVEDESKAHVDLLAASSSKEDDLDTTVEGDCSDDHGDGDVHGSTAASEATEMNMDTGNLCAGPFDEGIPDQKAIPKVTKVLSSNSPQKKFTPPHASNAMASQKRSADCNRSNSKPSKKAKTMGTGGESGLKPKAAEGKEKTIQKLKAEGKAERQMTKQKLRAAGIQPQKPLPIWVQCGCCKKWRVIHDCTDPSTLPDEWTCDMNSDVSVQSCSVPEIDWPDLTNSQEYVYSQFAQGSVVWAKQQGYPSWPGMIDNDPDLGVCMSWEEEDPPEDVPPSEYHVVYFGKPVSRAWVEAADIEAFIDNCPQNEGCGAYTKALDAAKREAQAALQEDTEVRLSKYSFAKRYGKGKRRAKQRCAADQDDDEVLPSKKTRRLLVKNLPQDKCSREDASADTKEGATGDEEAGGEPALASPTLEQTNRDSSPGK